MRLRHGSVADGLRRRQVQQRGSVGALGSDGQERGPARDPGSGRGRLGSGGDGGGFVFREQAQELHGLSAKPATNLDADNSQAASGARQLRVILLVPRGRSHAGNCSGNSPTSEFISGTQAKRIVELFWEEGGLEAPTTHPAYGHQRARSKLTERQEGWMCGLGWTLPFCALSKAGIALGPGLATRRRRARRTTEPPTSRVDNVPVPELPPHRPETHESMANLGPPPLVLLEAAGLLSADAQRSLRSHAPVDEWWPALFAALLARSFIPVRELGTAMDPFLIRCAAGPRFRHIPALLVMGAQVASLAESVQLPRRIKLHQLHRGPLQEAFACTVDRPSGASTLEHIADRLREGQPRPAACAPSLCCCSVRGIRA